jgi:hypothetical protein
MRHSFFTLALYGSELSALLASRFTFGESATDANR